MKKNFKLILALIMAAMMVVSMASVAAFADGESGTATGHSISVAAGDTHTYQVYQILTGDLSTDGKTLSNVKWGSGVTDAAKATDATAWAKSLEGLSGVDAVTAVDAVRGNTAIRTVSAGNPLTGLATGYYVMVDTFDPVDTTSGTYSKTETKALNVIKLVADVTMVKKWGSTENDKKIVGDTLAKDSGTNAYTPGKTDNNVSVGDTVEYELTGTVPENADLFKPGTFFFIFTDTLSEGLTFTDGSIEVYDGTTKLTKDTHYNVKTNVNTHTFEVGIIDAASYKGHTLKVKYKAVVNDNAKIGDEGNPNTSTVKYSRDPNHDFSGTPTESGTPGFPDSTFDGPIGETPEKDTITYTTGIEIQKVDENGEPLTGATFEISGQSAKLVVTKTESFQEDANGNYYLLKDGTYTMTEPTTENTMIDAQPGATKGYVVDAEATGTDVIEINGTKYRPVKSGEKPTHILKVGSAAAYESTTTKYKKIVTKGTTLDATKTHKAEQVVDSQGLARFDGLGAGQYTIKETVTPNGYNTVADTNVTIEYTTSGTARFTVSAPAVYEDGVVKIKVVNKKGGLLPETGGIGTTIFYVAGSILVLAAAILLITKRRMGAND